MDAFLERVRREIKSYLLDAVNELDCIQNPETDGKIVDRFAKSVKSASWSAFNEFIPCFANGDYPRDRRNFERQPQGFDNGRE